MTITSVGFLCFLLISVALFYLCPKKHRWIVLLISSIVFYVMAGALVFLPFLVCTSALVWGTSVCIGKLYLEQDQCLAKPGLTRTEKKEIRGQYKKKAKKYLLLALVIGIGILCATKFLRYVVYGMNLLLEAWNGTRPFTTAWILVPLGISYYTFSTIGYLLDVYWKRYPYEKSFPRFLLYTIYFPHMIQGPISRYNRLGAQLKKELLFDSQRVVFGLELMLWGFFKKLVLADRLSIFVSNVYNGGDHAGSIFLVAALFDAIQIYTDFSGYMDIVRGASQIFGVELERNFDHPFFSETVPEFWRRWHMSLGEWFKDYVYYPCSISGFLKKTGKKCKEALPERLTKLILVAIPVMLTWILTGLWHGTGMNYLCWGIYYGVLITISTAFAAEFQKVNALLKINTDCFSWHLFRKIRTFFCFVGGRMLTSPGTVYYGLLATKTIFFGFEAWHLVDGSLYQYGLNARNFILCLICMVVLWTVSMLQVRFSVRERLSKQNLVFRWIVIYLAIFAILIFGIYGIGYDASSFVYEQY